MSHSREQLRKKAEAQAEAKHHHQNSAVDGEKKGPGDFGYDLDHSALYRAGKRNPNQPLTHKDMIEAQKEIDEGR